MQFSLRKKTRKKKMNSSNPSYQSMDCVIKWVIDASILLEFFPFVSKRLSCNREKTAVISLKECAKKTGSASATL